MDADLQRFLQHAVQVLERLEPLLPPVPGPLDWRHIKAAQWRRHPQGGGHLAPIARPHRIRLSDLHGVERQKALLEQNTRQFVAGLPANNALLWGARGTGKSSLVKALLNHFARDGLRMIEVDKDDLLHLPDIVAQLDGLEHSFILYCDDLSFEAGDARYKTLKAVLDGSLAAAPENVLIYATSNRRHLLPERMQENLEAQRVDGEIHPGEATEEKISLSERFGLWVAFHPFNQDDYLRIVFHWLKRLKASTRDKETIRAEALKWALARGSRSGRVAWQFARDWAGRFSSE